MLYDHDRGFDTLVTALYVRGDAFETSDTVFGVKSSLIVDVKTVESEKVVSNMVFLWATGSLNGTLHFLSPLVPDVLRFCSDGLLGRYCLIRSLPITFVGNLPRRFMARGRVSVFCTLII